MDHERRSRPLGDALGVQAFHRMSRPTHDRAALNAQPLECFFLQNDIIHHALIAAPAKLRITKPTRAKAPAEPGAAGRCPSTQTSTSPRFTRPAVPNHWPTLKAVRADCTFAS